MIGVVIGLIVCAVFAFSVRSTAPKNSLYRGVVYILGQKLEITEDPYIRRVYEDASSRLED